MNNFIFRNILSYFTFNIMYKLDSREIETYGVGSETSLKKIIMRNETNFKLNIFLVCSSKLLWGPMVQNKESGYS